MRAWGWMIGLVTCGCAGVRSYAGIDEIRVEVQPVSTPAGDLYEFYATWMSSGEIYHCPHLTLLPGQWGTALMAEMSEKLLWKDSAAEPTLEGVQAIENGLLVGASCDARPDGLIGVRLRIYSVLEGRLAWSVREELALAPGELRIIPGDRFSR